MLDGMGGAGGAAGRGRGFGIAGVLAGTAFDVAAVGVPCAGPASLPLPPISSTSPG